MMRNTSRLFSHETLSKKLRVRHLLSLCPASIISIDEFRHVCMSAKNPEDSMDDKETTLFLDSLHQARIVIRDDHRVFIRPNDVVNRVHSKLGVPRFTATTMHDKSIFLDRELNGCAKRGTEATALWRNRFWGTVAVGSAAQMSILSYLTFITYGWDIMEPACYFVTCATSVFFYVYFLLYRREQSLVQVDENILPLVLQKHCRESGIDSKRWIECLEEINSLADGDKIGCRQPTQEFQDWLRLCSPHLVK
jgi:hypothetical protein